MLTRRRFVEKMVQATAGAAVVATVPDAVLEALDLLAPKRLYVPGAQTITTVTLTHWHDVRFPILPNQSTAQGFETLREQLARAITADFTCYNIPHEVHTHTERAGVPVGGVIAALQTEVAARQLTPLAAVVTVCNDMFSPFAMGTARIACTDAVIPPAQRPALIAAMQNAERIDHILTRRVR